MGNRVAPSSNGGRYARLCGSVALSADAQRGSS
jgi:hypothetical protein